MNDSRINKGKAGEDLAVSILESAGYEIITRNYQVRVGEIDIVAKKNGCVYFVEVRGKSNDRFGTAAESITLAKKKKIIKTAEIFLQEYNLACNCGFLLVAIDFKKNKAEIINDMLW